ncbi:hypothetical protein APHAL10511_000643 [Amanita phalloides]|nr:hypothetical protein APHAL10511_000643 [Amanita phalloides]
MLEHLPRLTGLTRLILVSLLSLLILAYYVAPVVRTTKVAKNTNPSADSNTHPPLRILLVSALFPLAKAKHSQSDYEAWLKRFVGDISTEIYFFAPPSLAPSVTSIRPSSFPLVVNTTFSSPFSVPPLVGLEANYTYMHSIDRENFRHSPELYAVWNAKAYFLAEAVKNMEAAGKTYDYVFWNDAGSFRDDHWYKVWPDPDRVRQVWEEGVRVSGMKKEDLMFFPLAGMPSLMYRWWKEDQGPIDVDMSEGSFFGGAPSAVRWWSKTFYAYHDYYLSRSFFVGKDQELFNALFFLFPDRFISMYYGDMPYIDQGKYSACGYGWWYYHFWFGDEEGKKRQRELWLSNLAAGWVFWRQRVDCTLAPVVPMRSVLEGRFGWGWTPPERRLEILYS